VVAAGLVYVLVRDLDVTPYDDGYFFKRFALNFLRHGAFAWNAADGPVHGLTSQAFELVSVALVALAPAHFVIAAKVFFAACLVATAWTFSTLALRVTERLDTTLAITLLVIGNPLVAWTVHTGMETSLVLLIVTLGLRTILDADGSPRASLKAASATLFVYLCRPDATLVPAFAFLVRNLRNRRALSVYAAALALGLSAAWMIFRVYYGTALPLPFYLKTLGFYRYEAAVTGLAAHDKLVHLATFAAFAAPLGWLCARGRNRQGFVLGAAALLLVAYHAAVTTEFMGYRSRFYVPALIPLGLGAAFGSRGALARPRREHVVFFALWIVAVLSCLRLGLVASASSSAQERLGLAVYLAEALLAGWLVFSGVEREGDERERQAIAGVALLFALGTLAALPPRRSTLLSDREFLEKSSAEVTTTRGIFDVERCLPNTKTLYHSEIGVPGLVLPETRIVDLTGLMSPRLALERPRFDDYCLRDRPEALFLPHRFYVEKNREIRASRCLGDYTEVVHHSSSPLFVRSDLVEDFRRCARDIALYE
jgi:hypothetical protein